MATEDDSRLVFISMNELTKASGLVDVHRDVWCLVHPDKGVVLFQIEPRRKGSAIGAKLQGNRNKTITDMIRDKHYPWAEVQLIQSIHIPIDPSDYV